MKKLLILLFFFPLICYGQTVTLDFIVQSKNYSVNELAEKSMRQTRVDAGFGAIKTESFSKGMDITT